MNWTPTNKQSEALVRTEYEILYGGARGGGKTDAGMAFPLYHIKNPGFKCLVIRRNADDLSDWIARAKIMYKPTGAEFTGKPGVIKFPSGAFIKLGHLKDEDAYEKYQGHEYQNMVIEELNQIPSEDSYLKLLSSCRSTIVDIKPQIFATANPGGSGHKWVKKRWRLSAVPAGPVETTDEKTGRKRVFIPAKVQDNPHLMSVDPDYLNFLNGLPDGLREQWRDGSWDDFDVKGAIYANELTMSRRLGRITGVTHEPSIPIHVWFDLGMGDMMSVGFFQFVGRERRWIDYYQNSGHGLGHYIDYLKGKTRTDGYQYGSLNFPHDIEVKELGTGKSRKEVVESLVPDIPVNVVKKLSIEDGIQAVRVVFPTVWIDERKCEIALDALSQYRYEWDELRQTYKPTPVHDWTSHPSDMFRYFAVGSSDMQGEEIDRKPQELGKSVEYNDGYDYQLPNRFHYE